MTHRVDVNRRQIDDDLPILEFYYAEVIERLERSLIKTPRKVSRKAVLDVFMATQDIKGTAKAFGISTTLVYQILHRAMYTARRIAGIWPPEPGLEGDGRDCA